MKRKLRTLSKKFSILLLRLQGWRDISTAPLNKLVLLLDNNYPHYNCVFIGRYIPPTMVWESLYMNKLKEFGSHSVGFDEWRHSYNGGFDNHWLGSYPAVYSSSGSEDDGYLTLKPIVVTPIMWKPIKNPRALGKFFDISMQEAYEEEMKDEE